MKFCPIQWVYEQPYISPYISLRSRSTLRSITYRVGPIKSAKLLHISSTGCILNKLNAAVAILFILFFCCCCCCYSGIWSVSSWVASTLMCFFRTWVPCSIFISVCNSFILSQSSRHVCLSVPICICRCPDWTWTQLGSSLLLLLLLIECQVSNYTPRSATLQTAQKMQK